MTPRDERPRVLVVDDTEMVRLLARQTLEQAGFEVDCVADGESAIDACLAFGPDLVLLDVMMPGRDGFETCAAIRALPGGARLPVLMMTGLDDVAAIHRAYEAGATDFIGKPIRWPKLAYRVRYMLRAARAIDDLATSESRLVSAQRAARLGHWDWHLADDSVQLSEMTATLLGLGTPGGSVPLEAMLDRIHADDREAVRSALRGRTLCAEGARVECRLASPDGTDRHVLIQCAGAHEAAPAHFAEVVTGTLQDITELKRSQQRSRFLAYHDPLTGLPNRLMFNEQLGRALARARRQGHHVAVLALDLDKFKRINETLGHAAGDLLLMSIAERLAMSVREEDVLARSPAPEPPGEHEPATTLARMGGDEFTIMISELQHVQDAAKVALRVLEVLRQPLPVAGQDVVISSSIGISMFPTDGDDSDGLLMNADSAMYHAKNEGGACFKFYNRPMNASAFERLSLEANLRKALDRDEFVLHYQPKLDLATRRIAGVEALLRWSHPGIGLVSPLEFVPLAEETGLIVPIGEWVLFEACRQAAEWQAQGLPPLGVAVNLSARQFLSASLADVVALALAAAGLAPGLLELEITESSIMQDVTAATATMQRLRALGCRISVDDFGTGYSSLAYLKRFPIDALKIDRSFIGDLPQDTDDAAIVRAVIGLAEGLQIRVIAEGVETQEQLDFLVAHRCDAVQGYFVGRPMPAPQLLPQLQSFGRAAETAAA